MYVSGVSMMKTVYDGDPLDMSSQLHIQWCHVGSLESAMVGVFALEKLANAANQVLYLYEWPRIKHLPAYYGWITT